ncbi:MAG: hypothetical protein R3C01_12090 [Planctomycetaceae bacterium]
MASMTRPGQQQLTLFHGYYEQNQYFPLIITNARSRDWVVMVSLQAWSRACVTGGR